jgi:cyclophilin family peptidyl-prolyl cis-trans isomerase
LFILLIAILCSILFFYSRTTQIFVNYVDNSFLDSQTGFVPFGKVVKGMGILTTIGGMYEPSSPVPVDQTTYTMEGNSWILQNYPDIDIIKGISNSEQPPKILLTLNEPSSVPSSAPSSSSDNDKNDDITTTTIGTITTDIIYPNEDPNDRPTPLTSSSAGSAGTTSKKIIIYCSGTVITLIFFSFVVHNVY